jgi:SHAQKYF class myb-like DNA-binding protein
MQEKYLKSYSFNTDTSIRIYQGVFSENHCSDENIDPGGSFRSGKWSTEEHLNFILGIIKYGNDWKEVQKATGTRSCAQLRSHSQKFFKKIRKRKDFETFKEIMLSVKSLHESAKKLSLNEFKSLVVSLVDFFEKEEETESLVENNDNYFSFVENNFFNQGKELKNEEKNSIKKTQSVFKEYSNISSFVTFCDRFVFECKFDQIEEVKRNSERMNAIKNNMSNKNYCN